MELLSKRSGTETDGARGVMNLRLTTESGLDFEPLSPSGIWNQLRSLALRAKGKTRVHRDGRAQPNNVLGSDYNGDMKRDMDLVRSILLKIEEQPYTGSFLDVSVPGHTGEEISYHIMLLDEAGLIEAENVSSSDGMDWKALRLTYAGHEFLDAARNDNVWSSAKEWVMASTGVLTLEALKVALPEVIKRILAGR